MKRRSSREARKDTVFSLSLSLSRARVGCHCHHLRSYLRLYSRRIKGLKAAPAECQNARIYTYIRKRERERGRKKQRGATAAATLKRSGRKECGDRQAEAAAAALYVRVCTYNIRARVCVYVSGLSRGQ